MRLQIRAFVALVGLGAVALGAQMYLNIVHGTSLSNIDSFMASLKSLLIASVIVSGGMWLSVRAIIPKNTA